MRDQLRLTLLGELTITIGDELLQGLTSRKAHALLIYLAVTGKTHNRSSLAGLLWPDTPEANARMNLRKELSRLRRVLHPYLKISRDTVGFDRSAEYWLDANPVDSDVTRLSTLLQRSRQHSHRDLFTCLDCRAWLEEAVTLYQGDFLADFSLYDNNSFEAWAQVKRESLRHQTLDALDTLTHIYMTEQDYQQAEKAARRQLIIDNLRENAYRQLMQILALTGRRSEAVALYDTCRRLLAEELGMAPATKTAALSEQIKGGSRSLVTPVQHGIRGYELGEKLGEGAFGSVYKAIQKGIGREVAIKIIHAKFANQPRFIRRFEAEAQIVARLEYPHIVPLYDYWREADGAYLVMRLLHGGSLQAAMEKELFAVETAVTLITQIAGALHAAHRQGIIHRDVKPANILLDEEGNAYLSDFGIARDTSANLQLTQAHELPGSPNYISPEQLLGETVTPATDIYCLGLVLYKLLTGSQPYSTTSMAELIQKQINEPLPLIGVTRPDLPTTIDDIIQQATAKKAVDRFKDTVEFAEALHQAVSGTNGRISSALPPITTVAETDIINPYKGLHAFQKRDAEQFFGRQALIEQLLAQLDPRNMISLKNRISDADNRFLAIVGPSGSGKSSVVKAGLIPALNKGALPGSADWFIVEMTPGSYPLEELESALLRVAVNPPPSLLEPLQKDERGLLRVLKRLLPQDKNKDNPSQLLLVIDQFEELFTLVKNEADRTQFLNNIFTALTDVHSRLWVIVTLRADFYDRPLQVPQLGEWLRQRTELVLPLTVTELEQAITAPAAHMGVTLELSLVSAIIADVKEQPGALPLLQYALTELFERRNSRKLTLAAYKEIGGVTGALARRADDIYNRLDTSGQEASRQLFLRLVSLGEGMEDTRRRVLRSELEAMQTSDFSGNLDVLAIYGRYRLLTFDNDPISRGPTVEVAHEALLHEWPRLRQWLLDGREDVRQQRLLAEAASQWENANQESSYLLRGGRLLAFAAWAETTTMALTNNERKYLKRSTIERDRRQSEEEARRQHELETAEQLAKEQTRRAEEQTQAAYSLRQRALFLTVALVVAAILAIAAFAFARSSTGNANLASTREAEAVANLHLAATNEADAITNAKLASTREAEAKVERESALAAQQLAQNEANSRSTAEAIAIENQGLAEEQLQLTTSRELALAANANLDTNPELSLLLGLAALDTTYTKEAEEVIRAALQASRVELTLTMAEESVDWIVFHPEGNWLAGIGNDGILIIWDTGSGEKLQTVPLDITGVNHLDIAPDGSLLAVASQNRLILLDTGSFAVTQKLDGHLNDVIDIEFSPDSTLIASSDKGGVMKIWQVASGEEQFSVTASDIGWVNDVAFSHDGSKIATGGDDQTARIWDVATGEELVRLPYDTDYILSVTFNADDTRLFAASAGGISGSRVIIWDIATVMNSNVTDPFSEWVDIHDNVILNTKLSPDGRYLATSSQDSTVKLWDVNGNGEKATLTLAGHQSSVIDIAFSPDGQTIASTSGGTARVWNVSEAGLGEVLNIAEPIMPIAFSPDNLSLVTGSDEGIIKLWDVATGRLLNTFDSLVKPGIATMSPDGRFLAITGDDNIIKIWDITTQQQVSTITGHGPGIAGGFFTGVQSMDYSPDGQLLATGGADGHMMVWDVATDEKLYDWRVHPDNSSRPGNETYATAVFTVRFSPDGHFLAAGTDMTMVNGVASILIKVWDLESGEELIAFSDIPSIVRGLAFSPDSTRIVGTGFGGFIKLWDVTTGEQIANLEGATNTISSVQFSADGNRLMTGGRTEIVVWEIATEEALFKLPQGLGTLVLSPNGRYLAAVGEKGVYIYTLDFEELLAIAQSRVTRALTEAECKQYLHLDTCPAQE